MISEFQDLSDKIDQLAAVVQSLRGENYLLRQANLLLSAENVSFKDRLNAAQHRVEALLDQLPSPALPEAPPDAVSEAVSEAAAEPAPNDAEATQ